MKIDSTAEKKWGIFFPSFLLSILLEYVYTVMSE